MTRNDGRSLSKLRPVLDIRGLVVHRDGTLILDRLDRLDWRVQRGEHWVIPDANGSGVMVWQVLAGLRRGETVDELCAAWPHAVTPEAVAEAVDLAGIMFQDARCAPYAARAVKLVRAR